MTDSSSDIKKISDSSKDLTKDTLFSQVASRDPDRNAILKENNRFKSFLFHDFPLTTEECKNKNALIMRIKIKHIKQKSQRKHC